jgi:hypothetical protein
MPTDNRRLTLTIARTLKPGDYLHDRSQSNSDGTPRRWKVNGAVKTWKTDASRIYVPLKHGMRSYDGLNGGDFDGAGKCRHDLWTGYGV